MYKQTIDWAAVWRGDTSTLAPFVHADLEVAPLAGKGRGVVARAPIRPGQLLLAERALAVAPEALLPERLIALQDSLDAVTRLRLRLMCNGEDGSDSMPHNGVALAEWPGKISEPHAVSLPRMRRIVDLNAYRCSSPLADCAFEADGAGERQKDADVLLGLFPLGSLFNHSCLPNVGKVLLEDWVILRASRDIRAKDELLQYYVDIRMPYEMRQKETIQEYGFRCDCNRCHVEAVIDRQSIAAAKHWRNMYSCQLPRVRNGRGQVHCAMMEGHVAEMELGVHAAFSCYRAEISAGDADVKQWLLWSLVPAVSQLAEQLRLDGRLAESIERWCQAERAVRVVLPYSNVHVRVLGEVLLARAQLGCDTALNAAIAASLQATAMAYGGGLHVWRQLVGFRMTHRVSAQAERMATENDSPQHILCSWSAVTFDESSGSRKAVLTARCPVFDSLEDISLEVSSEQVRIGAPGAEVALVPCPFPVDLVQIQNRFLRRHCTLIVSISESASSVSSGQPVCDCGLVMAQRQCANFADPNWGRTYWKCSAGRGGCEKRFFDDSVPVLDISEARLGM